MWDDFKAFILKGNVLDLAIGVILGAAFGTVVKTFTDGIIMPFVGLVTGRIDFKEKFWTLTGAVPAGKTLDDAVKAGDIVVVRYGQLISDIITFLIVGLVLFFIARFAMGFFARMAAKSSPPAQEVLLTEIRDILKEKSSSPAA